MSERGGMGAAREGKYKTTVTSVPRQYFILQLSCPHFTVVQQTYVMSCHGTFLQGDWDSQLGIWGMKLERARKAEKACVKACIQANNMLAEVRR
mmetsp:Transcript_70607/g.147049  ORF Transcript_70607/g.147049 Transcript_70607/m.147049 type:complete len:94 (+) Transcript_70607:652-933(+)